MYMIAEVSQYVAVASFAEAWIEITRATSLWLLTICRLLRGGVDWNLLCVELVLLQLLVASFAEAWIEISINPIWALPKPSPPSRRRGLKYRPWKAEPRGKTSPPSRRRGLKFLWSVCIYNQPLSPPSRRRGLKSRYDKCISIWSEVASFAEAWIEIYLTICPELS